MNRSQKRLIKSLDNSIHCIFQPLILRSGPLYRGLGRHIFSPAEKAFVCQVLVEEKCQPQQLQTSIRAFCLMYSIGEYGVNMWIRQYKAGEAMCAGPCLVEAEELPLDDIAVAAILQYPSTRRLDEGQSHYQNRWNIFLHDQMCATANRRQSAL